jgi:hypothetical protein
VVFVRVNEKKQTISLKLSIIVGLLLSILFSWIDVQTIAGGENSLLPGVVFYPAISLLLGFLVICSVGLYYDESTKIWGIFFFSFLLPLILSYGLLQRVLYPDFFIYGVVIGILLGGYYITIRHHEIFADYVKIALKIFTAVMLFIVLYNFFMLLFRYGFIESYNANKLGFISYIVNTVIILGLYLFVIRKIRGVDGSKVFVFGPSKSGKTYFMLGMYKQFVGFFEGHSKEVIICGDQKEEKLCTLAYYLGQIDKNEPLRSNVTDMVGIYTLIGKKGGLKNIELTIVDYAGEWVHDLISKIDPVNNSSVIAKLSESLDIDTKTLAENIGFVKFIKSIKESHRDIVPTIIDDVVLSFIYKRLTSSGKIILLIDGDKVAKDDGPSRDELTRLFGYYAKIMDYVGEEKQYALVVTKTDTIEPIDTVAENSPRAEEIEAEVFNKLHTFTTFQAIENKAGSTPIFFFTVSVNPMNKNDEQVSQIFPWRFGEVAKFEF